jgi:uncharacterized repeat protein (TIGR03803 family)
VKNHAWSEQACIISFVCAMAAVASSAQTFNSVPVFAGTNGANPEVSLTQGADGDYYGLALFGGEGSHHTQFQGGVFFRATPKGEMTALYNFCSQINCADGENPSGGLLLATDGYFYGTANGGGAHGYGTVFKMTPGGELTTLYSFCTQENCADGMYPSGTLMQAIDGSFYGTTQDGGPHGNSFGGGTVFRITPSGELTTLYGFCAQEFCGDGSGPESVGLVQATDGDFYGTTTSGGANNFGTVFKITPGGALTTIYSFCSQSDCDDGADPRGSLVQGSDGDFYGTTAQGGLNAMGNVFKITPGGQLTTLYIFCNQNSNCPDGAGPTSGVIQATDGNFYGTTTLGGANGGGGTLFKITPGGDMTTLYSFCAQTNCADGNSPIGGLLQATSGTFYGNAYNGGLNDCADAPGCGTLFSLNVGLGPFVTTLPAAGKVGAEVGIIGPLLTGATRVFFNGISAQFKVVSPTLILADVPTRASTGEIMVDLPGGTLSSNVPFYVLP